MNNQPTKPAGIREIAAALGVSIGTVDRALYDRPGISAKTRERVMRMAEKLNYSPNRAARNLKLNKHLRFGVFLPQQIDSFFNLLRNGIRDAASSWATGGISVSFFSYPRLGEGDVAALKRARWEQFDGIILAPGYSNALANLLRSSSQNIPIVLVATDSPRLPRLASVTIDAVSSGGVAAELLGQSIKGDGIVAAFTGDLRIADHADKLRGFAATLATLAPHLRLLPAIESHDRRDEARSSALALFKKHPELTGLYINTANSLPVLEAAEKLGKLGRIQIVTTDLFPDLIPHLESNAVLATLYQRPLTQGRMAFEALAGHLAAASQPAPVNRLAAHIVLRSNMSLFSDLLSQGN